MASEQKKRRKKRQQFTPYQEKFHLHFSTVIFGVLFVYLAVILVRYAMKDTTGVYEVVTGNNGLISSYSGLIIRDETLFSSDKTGYVNYYAEQGDRLRVGSSVCTLDENGDFMSQLLTNMGQSNSLNEDKLKRFKNTLYSISTSFDENHYEELYTEKNNLNTALLSLLTEEAMGSYVNASDQYTFDVVLAPVSGIFVPTYDGYENFNPEDFSSTQIAPENYTLTTVSSGQIVSEGQPLYKMISSDAFSLLFQMTESDLITYWENKTLTVYFPAIQRELTGDFSFVFDQEGNRYCKVDFTECGYLLANTRFTDIQVVSRAITGLKIPQSAVTTKDYYLIPKDYTLRGGNSNSLGCNVQVFEDGVPSARFTEISVTDTYEDYYLVDTKFFDEKALIQKEESSDLYEVSAKKTLQGVYNLNKGYAVFKMVRILDTLEDGYYIVEDGVSSSISTYDRIAINAQLIQEGEIIY